MHTVDTFYAVDFDRCLARVDACFGLLQEVLIDKNTTSVDDLQKARAYVEATGETFLIFDYLASISSEQEARAILDEFIRRGKAAPGSLFEDGASELLAWLKEGQRTFGIITHGEKEWQLAKIAAAGLDDCPRMIAEHKNKASYVASWHDDPTGLFRIESDITGGTPIIAKRVVLIDDRAIAFDGLPEDAYGYWIVVDGVVKTFQQGIVPENVMRLDRISDVISYEQ